MNYSHFNTDDYFEVNQTKDIQILLLYLFSKFKSICEQNGFRYFAFGGTFLGAVRHAGFIPWDDDMDIGMPRPDYEKLLDYMKTHDNETVELMSFPKKNYAYPFGKFCLSDSLLIEDYKDKYSTIKLYLDIFPVDGYPPSKFEKKYFSKLRILKKLRVIKMDNNIRTKQNLSKSKYFQHLLLQGIAFFIPMKYILKAEIEAGKKYPYKYCEYSLLQGAGWYEKGKIKKSELEKVTQYPFEGDTIVGICNANYNLSMFYGDYMSLPSAEEQASNHNYHLYIPKSLSNELLKKA